jgi:tRNA pseudouridine38-40 synthase
MRNIALLLEYDGSRFHGWQSQTNAPTVQALVAAAISRLDGRPTSLVGASRTDAGVHARGQVAHFFTESRIPAEKYAYALNALLPEGINCVGSREATPDFHARFSAVGKAYSYQILNRRFPSALLRERVWHVPLPLELDAMRAAAALFVGEHDFSAFMSTGSPVKTTVRTIFSLTVEAGGERETRPSEPSRPCEFSAPCQPHRSSPCQPHRSSPCQSRGSAPCPPFEPGLIRVNVSGDGFLYNMVRIIVGTLVYAGLGKLGAKEVAGALASGARDEAGKTAPPQGLFLERVWYPPPHGFLAAS